MPETLNGAVRERPILFSGPMVRAILDGRKSQTRRVVKCKASDVRAIVRHGNQWMVVDGVARRSENREWITCPYGQPGDRLWVRESFSYVYGRKDPHREFTLPIWYWADGEPAEGDWTKPKPSIHVPRWASRLSLEITEVRVQRLHEISEEDVRAEGCEYLAYRCAREMEPCDPKEFSDLWDMINARRGYSWEKNPWVWALSFRAVESSPLPQREDNRP